MGISLAFGDVIPDDNHVSRVCRSDRNFTEDGLRITSTAFKYRTDELGNPTEKYLSVNWLEKFHDADRDIQIDGIRRCIRLKLKGYHRFAVTNVGHLVKCVNGHAESLSKIHVEYRPSEDPSHSGIMGMLFQDNIAPIQMAEAANDMNKIYVARP